MRPDPPIGAERERGHGVVVAAHNGVSCAAAATHCLAPGLRISAWPGWCGEWPPCRW